MLTGMSNGRSGFASDGKRTAESVVNLGDDTIRECGFAVPWGDGL
jgi:hypothetical protein